MVFDISSDFQDTVVSRACQVAATKPTIFSTTKHKPKNAPRIVSELKPVGVVDAEGALVGIRFQNIIGDDEHVMARAETVPNARIYQGIEDGFKPAMEIVHSEGAPSRICSVVMSVLDKEFMTKIPVGHRKIEMQLRLVQRRLNDKEFTPLKPREAGSGRAFIILPGNPQLDLAVLKGFSTIILEEAPSHLPSLLNLCE
ncbi:hypothetical protein FANTH_6495 [Fusarium anthophilum]|uniref:Uncharacterized protein n=1 Tax=Fusarium anthophilum TaxID=48485 RepID=A0A8H4ZIU4_9HYPO|nr:hypothetical protein FANTH_6495 [Fusarium anthophilum]